MQERKLKAGVESEPILSRQAVERQVEEPAAQGILSPQRDPLAQVTCRAGDVSCASAHASTLNRATDSYPAHAGQSLQQLQRQYGNRYVQRVLALARTDAGEASAAPEVERAIQGARGGGQALDSGVRAQMEPALGADFSGVRVHADAGADALNRSLNARAFTSGRDVFFRQGTYNPGSSSGRELLAHELTHVVQQNGDQIRTKLTVGQPGDRYEQEADQVARAVLQQEGQPIRKDTDEGPAQRQVEEEEEEEPIQAKAEESWIQRQAEEEEEEEPVQAKAEDGWVQRQTEEEEEEPPV
jgi:hypothetical protein